MDSNRDKFKAYLCRDHFERLVQQDTCATCPSQVENSAAVKALAKVYDDNPHRVNEAIIVELKSIRKTQERLFTEHAEIKKLLRGDGNGVKGLQSRVLLLEAASTTSKQATAFWLGLIGVIVSAVAGFGGLLIALSR